MSVSQAIDNVNRALEAVRRGGMVIMVDDADRENEGDLVMAAELTTPEAINFMAKFGRGLICLSLTAGDCERLHLPLMVGNNRSLHNTAFTASIEAREGVTTGISAADRATTIRAAVRPDSGPEDLIQPGHVFPLRAAPGGVLVRSGHTEGSVDLARLAGLRPAGVICEIMNDDGTMARRPELEEFARRHDLPLVSIADLIEYRMRHERLAFRIMEREVVSRFSGQWRVVLYGSHVDQNKHLALIKGAINPEDSVPVRVHTESLLADVFGIENADRQLPVSEALREIDRLGRGIVLYMRPAMRFERPIEEALRAMADESPPREQKYRQDLREFGVGAQILLDLGVRRLRLMTCNPKRIVGLEGYGLTVVEQWVPEGQGNERCT